MHSMHLNYKDFEKNYWKCSHFVKFAQLKLKFFVIQKYILSLECSVIGLNVSREEILHQKTS